MSILCLLTVACLLTGVLATVIGQTEVHIKVYVPPNFLRYKPEVFIAKGKFVNVTSNLKHEKFDVDVYGNI